LKQALFIDPGDVHVGMAKFHEIKPDVWTCVNTWEIGPALGEEMLADILTDQRFILVCYERWRLFGHLAQQQTGSEFRAVQFIGVLKYLHRRTAHSSCILEVQDPKVQPVALSVANNRQIKLRSVTEKRGNHAKSAELHGVYYFTSRNLSVINDRLEE
jgi:hypothetical protein